MNFLSNQNESNMSHQSANSQQDTDPRKFPLNKIKSSDNCLLHNNSSTSKINNIKKQQSNNELISNRLTSSTGQSGASVVFPNPIKLNSATTIQLKSEIQDESFTSDIHVNMIEIVEEQLDNRRSQTAIDAKSAEVDAQSDAINQCLDSKLIINNESKISAFRPFKSKKQQLSHHPNEPNEFKKVAELSSTSSAASSSSASHKNQMKSNENSSESKEMVEADGEYEHEEVDDDDDSTAENKSEKKKQNTKRFAFAWVGKKMAKRVSKKQISSGASGSHNHHHHFIHMSHHHNHFHHHAANIVNNLPSGNSKRNKSPSGQSSSPSTALTENESTTSIVENSLQIAKKPNNRIDWTENAKQGTHFWSDLNSQALNTESCYLNDTDVLEFHNLDVSIRCQSSSSKNTAKKRCNICKIVVHESCIDQLQAFIKCRVTFREAARNSSKKKSFKEVAVQPFSSRSQSLAVTNLTSSSLAMPSSVNIHHWICRKFDEEYFENKCQACLKSYTNRFGLQKNRTIVSCSWCKASYHLKCFSPGYFKLECSFGELNQLIVPPNWIIKSVASSYAATSSLHQKAMSFRSSFMRTFHRSSKRHCQQQQQQQQQIAQSQQDDKQSQHESLNNNDSSNSKSNYLNKVFIIRPPTSPNVSLIKPVLVLINPKSGGKLGPKLYKKFTWLLNARQVFDLTAQGGPKLPLYLYRNVPNLKLLVGGGDGTVGWVLSVIDQIRFLASPPSVAVLPLGTGNDLARALNWGGAYTNESLSKLLAKTLESRNVKLDRWKILTQVNQSVDLKQQSNKENSSTENAIEKLKNDVMNNYFSIGADAHVCLEFHERREANPHKFTSRWFNLLQYVEAGSKDFIKKTWKDLKDYIELECDNKNYTELIRSRGYHCLIFLNIPKYCSGTNPWGNSFDPNYQPQAMNDGRLEVIGCFTSTLTKFQLGGTGERICQAKYIKLTTSVCIPIQIDGEPAKLVPSIIEIKHKNQALMLEYVKHNTDSPILGYQCSIQKNFQVKCILMEDYESFEKNTHLIEEKAVYIGIISTSGLTDPLHKIRTTINLLIKNCANGFFTDKWSFLNGEEFYRINEDSDECLLDIVSFDEIVYILDENLKFTNKASSSAKCELTQNEVDLVSEQVHLAANLNSTEAKCDTTNESNKRDEEHPSTERDLIKQREVVRFPSSHSFNFLTSKKICDL